jgi:release factor glutamine methyltransferase
VSQAHDGVTHKNPTYDELWRAMARRIGQRPYADGAREARLLIEYVTGLSSSAQIGAAQERPSSKFRDELEALVARREAGEPLARLTGKAAFWDFEVDVNTATLIPRDDTGVLVEAALARLPQDQPVRVVDVGTGTGIILLALARERQQLTGLGIDVAQAAVQQAARNAEDLGLAGQLTFSTGNWLDGVDGPVDMVVSNPPYVSTSEMAGLTEEVRKHDPGLALVAGDDGLDAYRVLLPQASSVVRPAGFLLVEIGSSQKQAVTAIGEAVGWHLEDSFGDLSGHDRVLVFQRPGER